MGTLSSTCSTPFQQASVIRKTEEPSTWKTGNKDVQHTGYLMLQVLGAWFQQFSTEHQKNLGDVLYKKANLSLFLLANVDADAIHSIQLDNPS